ncbi:hypothetical protein VN24_09265 [Paenibacillus beijingensis]|uniref:Uncharacterized protein n=1 Tax=Paenibacillus beijingensis TaxID=1126833 RepID=A0A0D5NIJ5_9BACL|nr:hypothetical protein VN24_09265 [Paenibacillus beijingensis]
MSILRDALLFFMQGIDLLQPEHMNEWFSYGSLSNFCRVRLTRIHLGYIFMNKCPANGNAHSIPWPCFFGKNL